MTIYYVGTMVIEKVVTEHVTYHYDYFDGSDFKFSSETNTTKLNTIVTDSFFDFKLNNIRSRRKFVKIGDGYGWTRL